MQMRILLPAVAAALLLACVPASERRDADVAVKDVEGYTLDGGARRMEPNEASFPMQAPAPAPPGVSPGAQRQTRAQIYEGNVHLRVGSVDSAVASVTVLARELGGHTGTRLVRYGEERSRSAMVQLRVPADRFDDALTALATVGRLEHSAVNVHEVGEQIIDLRARLENARRLESRLLELLRTRTGRLQDVLTVERELARVREEIERLDAQLTSLGARVAMSSIHVALREPGPVVAFAPAGNVIAESFRQAWRNFVHLTAAVIASLGVIVPIAAAGMFAWILVRIWRRPSSGRRQPPGTGGEATAGGILGG